MRQSIAIVLWASLAGSWTARGEEETAARFRDEIAPILQRHCIHCHSGDEPQGDIDLSAASGVIEGRGAGWIVSPGSPDDSRLMEVVSGEKPAMPKTGDPLSASEVANLRRWIADGAVWPDDVVIRVDPLGWWSLKPLQRPRPPELSPDDRRWARTPIDAFVSVKLREAGLAPSREADRRTLMRRVCFDLTGLPPTPEEVEAFVEDPAPDAYERLVDRLLDSPQYGERWARHWLDAVHYGDTHGYDKDKVRPHAWPYRDYVIRSFNDDKQYSRFVREQLAGDRFYPGTEDGVTGLGFIAAGPFDFVGQIEVANDTMEKRRVRNADRDDMVSVTMNTFVSLTAQCARCHDHKFDPISQEDYYSLQAVFAAVDRADRKYDADPAIAAERLALGQALRDAAGRKRQVEQTIARQAGPRLADIDQRLAELQSADKEQRRPEYGYHSAVMPRQDATKWVQVDLGKATPIVAVECVAAEDDYAGIGAGFGFPVRYRIEASNDPEFKEGVRTLAERTAADVPNPGIAPQSVAVDGEEARYVRFTATKLARRKEDYIFALAELKVLTADGANAATGAAVTALDSIEAPVRWGRANLVDGIYPGRSIEESQAERARLRQERAELLASRVDGAALRRQANVEQELRETEAALARLPPPQQVYAAATEFEPQGQFRPTHGEPRPIFVLGRGDEKNQLHEVGPGTVGCVRGLESRFSGEEMQEESQRRAALAEWIVDPANPLTWRSIVNRVWRHHLGRGIVETPNDFGRMGAAPTHPELLDWLAVEFREGGESLKDLHRLIVTSATYRQSSEHRPEGTRLDAGNRLLWRANRQRLDAEAVRDAALAISGVLQPGMGGPGFREFAFEDDHSPRYLYREHDPADPATHRRSIYRFIVRSVPDPFMTTLDCADPSLIVDRRNETLTPLQALALLNNPFMVHMAGRFAERVQTQEPETREQVNAAIRLALQRAPRDDELEILTRLGREHGLANVCRLLLNSNEFLFLD